MKRLRFLWTYASKWRGQVALSVAALTFVSFTSLLYPWLVKHLIDHFETGLTVNDSAELLAGGIILVLI
ncbi:MAG TPA: hypothetical protein DGH68_07795, partial [Bacteroidetes bacterium]|nr:hypothetical protein [Bacteroidota bacterium]